MGQDSYHRSSLRDGIFNSQKNYAELGQKRTLTQLETLPSNSWENIYSETQQLISVPGQIQQG